MPTELRTSEAVGLFFRHACNGVLLALTAATAGLGAWLAGASGLPGLLLWLVAGVAMWPLLEYGTHRWVLHAKPLPWAWAQRLQRRAHYDHHVDPRNVELLFAPLWFTIPAPLVLGALYATVLPPVGAAGLLAGNLLAMSFYEWVHFVSHVPYTPRTAYFRKLKTMHTWHHYKNERYWFGVTEGAMDRAFGTRPEVTAVATSPTVKALHGDDAV